MSRIRNTLLLFTALLVIAASAQPVNDDPCDAIALVVGDTCSPMAGTDSLATATVGIPEPGCASYLGHDVWFSFVAPEPGMADITLVEGSLTDAGMALYAASSCSGPFELIACDDDGGAGLMPRIFRSDLTAATTYWIRAFGLGTATGSFSICVSGPTSIPDGDCLYRLELFDALGDGWSGASLAISVNGGSPASYTCQTSYATYLIGLNFGDVVAIQYTAGIHEAENSYRLRLGNQGPYVFEDGPSPAQGVAFSFENSCTAPAPPPCDCPYRLPVCADSIFEDPVVSTGLIADLDPGNQGCLASGERSGMWIEITPATSGTLGLTITPTTPGDFDFALWGPFTDVVCPLPVAPVRCSYAAGYGPTGLLATSLDNSEGAGGDRFVSTLQVMADQRYVLLVDNFTTNGSGFGLSFQLSGGATLACSTAPEADFLASSHAVLVDEPVSFTDLSTNAPFAWFWSFPGAENDASVVQNPEGITYPLPGCYDVSLSATNALGTNSITHPCEVEVSISSAIGAADHEGFSVHVADDLLSIHRPGCRGPWSALLLDASGRRVLSFNGADEGTVRPISHLPTGVYSVLVQDPSGQFCAPVLVVR